MRPSRPLIARLLILAVLAAVAAILGLRAASRVAKYRKVDRVCTAAEAGDWETVIARSAPLVGPDPEGLRAAECRCTALLETGAQADCVDLLEGLLARPEVDDWLPRPLQTAMLVAAREERGELPAAADLARRGARAYPESSVLLVQELVLRSRTEDESSVLEEMDRRLDELEGRAASVLTLRLAGRVMRRQEWKRSLELLGERPDRFPDDLRDLWFRLRTESLAGLGETERLAAAFETWRRRGGEPAELRAHHALLLSTFHLLDPDHPTREGLLRALDEADQIEDRALLRSVAIRLIRSLVVEGRHERALEVLERAEREVGELELVNREDILRSATLETLGEERLTALTGTLRFRIDDPRPGDRLLLAPAETEPADAPYRSVEVPAHGVLELEAHLGTWPQRWVLRDAGGRARGSGAVWPTPEGTVEAEVTRRPAAADPTGSARTAGTGRRPGDGVRRVVQVVLDCADWRLVQYGRARGELPFFDRMVASGRRAVLDSVPPFTAVAITKLVYPDREGLRSVAGVLHRLGAEVEGLNAVGVNPLAPLEAVLPAERQMFEAFAADGLSTVNLLRSHGPLVVGREAEIVGPGDSVRRLSGYRAARPLTGREREILGDAAGTHLDLLREMAADFDLLEGLADEGAVDFVSVRVASLDLLTHGLFQEMNRTVQDDGETLLYRVYRYLDHRLEALSKALDRDDVLLVMSDHGIRTPMEHDRRALFLAAGGGVAPGRIPGSPPIRTVSGWVADMLGVDTDWPGAGDTPWVAPPPESGPRNNPRL